MNSKNKEEFDRWFQSVDDQQPVDLLKNIVEKEGLRQELWQRVATNTIVEDESEVKRKPYSLVRRLRVPVAIAASLLLTLTFGYLFLNSSKRTEQNQVAAVKPGREAASLTLSDGKKILLVDLQVGQVATEEGLTISKTKNGELTYEVKAAKGEGSGFNILSTSKGETYTIKLPDGSLAKLNAASSLSYPVNFGKHERRVKMTGEVYFEVAKVDLPDHTGRMPFFVETAQQQIQVLGTQFNVNAYKEEPYIQTTLVEGSVRVSTSSGRSALLRPGQQAMVANDISVGAADMESQLAWINGDFVFKREELKSILYKISRWYDVEIDCPESLGKLRFTGMVARSQPLADVMEMISALGKIKLTLKERRLVVTP